MQITLFSRHLFFYIYSSTRRQRIKHVPVNYAVDVSLMFIVEGNTAIIYSTCGSMAIRVKSLYDDRASVIIRLSKVFNAFWHYLQEHWFIFFILILFLIFFVCLFLSSFFILTFLLRFSLLFFFIFRFFYLHYLFGFSLTKIFYSISLFRLFIPYFYSGFSLIFLPSPSAFLHSDCIARALPSMMSILKRIKEKDMCVLMST